MRILVADDDRLNREILSRQLAALDYEVVSCADGREATPIFILIWLIKITQVMDLLIVAVSFRSAWDISLA